MMRPFGVTDPQTAQPQVQGKVCCGSGRLPPSRHFHMSHPPRTAPAVAPISAGEIKAGLVVLRLDPSVLSRDRRVLHTQDPPVLRPGPFLCVEVTRDETIWAGLTTQHRDERLPFDHQWRINGTKRWRRVPMYLADGASLWCGPAAAFVRASWDERGVGTERRARVSPIGLEAVRAEIARQRNRRHRSSTALAEMDAAYDEQLQQAARS